MLLRAFFCFTILITAAMGHGQQSEQMTEAKPEGGIENLVNVFYDIEFTDDQLKRIKQSQVKLLIKVSRHGFATLYKVSDVFGQDIEDSLYARKHSLPSFEPRTIDGVAHPSFYTIRLIPPFDYEHIPEEKARLSYFGIWAKTEDLEFVERGPRRRSNSYGLMSNVFLGSPGDFLMQGLGIFVETRYPLEKRERDLVFSIDLFANQAKEEFALEPDGAEFNGISGFAFTFGYSFILRQHRFTPNFQLMASNLISFEEERTTEFESRLGLGFTYSLIVPISGELLRIRRNSFISQRNLAFSIRSGYFLGGSTVLGRGAMIDLRLAYAIQKQSIRKLRYKDSFYEQTKK